MTNHKANGRANGEPRWRPPHKELHKHVGKKAERRLRAQRSGQWNSWFGMGMFGMVGWSVAVPTLLGAALGVWIDNRWPGPRSWTVIMLFAGLTLGLLVAIHWVKEECGDCDEDEKR